MSEQTMQPESNALVRTTRPGLYILTALLILVALTQTQNMFQFPYYYDVEGTNISNAWAIANEGDLSPYTYAYEDPPAGSVLLTLWSVISGWTAFGFTLNTGRAFMMVCHLAATALVFGIGYKISKSNLSALLAALIFAFSPLSVSMQRIVLLDNIMLVWLLASFYLLLGENRKLSHYTLSALLFGLAALTKGLALYFFPFFLYVIFLRVHQYHKRFAVSIWIALALFLISLFPLYAQMRLELFPEGWLFGGDFPHVSLIEAATDRGPDTGRFLNIGAGLSESFDLWSHPTNPIADPVLMYGGIIAAIFMLIVGYENKEYRPLVAMLLASLFYLTFNTPVFPTDVITALPFLALAVGLSVGVAARFAGGWTGAVPLQWASAAIAMAIMLYPFWVLYANRMEPYTVNQVEGQISAVEWIQRNVPDDAVVVTDNYAFMELRQTMPNAHHYWKIDTDPEIKFSTLEDSACNIDYMIVTNQVYTDIDTFNLDLMRRAIEDSELLWEFPNNGYPIEVRQVTKSDCVFTEETAQTP